MARRLPAEWETHASTVVAWPGRPQVWADRLHSGQDETCRLIEAVSKAEPVLVATNASQLDQVKACLGENPQVSVASIPLDDCWARDISPLFVVDTLEDSTVAVDFLFNAWGEKFQPHQADAAFGAALSSYLHLARTSVDLVLEGGSISTDGQGTAIIVETTVINTNRNPNHTKATIEEALRKNLSIEEVIWLPFGLLGDTDTDGHTDNVAVFCAPGRVLAQAPIGRLHPDNDRLAENLRRLRRARDVHGNQLEIVEIPWLPVSKMDGSRPCSYINSYPTNRSVLVPVTASDTDDRALDVISQAFDDLPPVPITSNALSYGGGGPHCMTMQVPAISARK